MTESSSELAIVTGKEAPALSDDGKQLAAALATRGVQSEPVMWNDPSVEWRSYDAVLLRSCWDYPADQSRFRAMLDELERAGVPVCNPIHVLQWNHHKSYLVELADSGVRIPQTTVIERGTDRSLEALFESQGLEEAVVKPAVGTGSTDVWRVSRSAAGDSERRFSELVAEHDVLVQQFVPDIAAGERSIVFFGGEYSHAWNSPTTEEDITAFEGIDAAYEPSSEIRRQASEAVQAACDILGIEPQHLPYARVDYVRHGSELLLLELELIEPHLRFGCDENSVDRFVEVLLSYFEEGS